MVQSKRKLLQPRFEYEDFLIDSLSQPSLIQCTNKLCNSFDAVREEKSKVLDANLEPKGAVKHVTVSTRYWFIIYTFSVLRFVSKFSHWSFLGQPSQTSIGKWLKSLTYSTHHNHLSNDAKAPRNLGSKNGCIQIHVNCIFKALSHNLWLTWHMWHKWRFTHWSSVVATISAQFQYSPTSISLRQAWIQNGYNPTFAEQFADEQMVGGESLHTI